MVAVADLERFLERLFERTSARLFRSRIQAVQVERRVERAMEAGRTGRGASTTVPSRYRVRLHPADLDDVARATGGFEALAVRLADDALAFARLHGYHLAARPMVSVVADPSVERGRVEVDASDGPPRPTSTGVPRPTGDELPPGPMSDEADASAPRLSAHDPLLDAPASLAVGQPAWAELAATGSPPAMAPGVPSPGVSSAAIGDAPSNSPISDAPSSSPSAWDQAPLAAPIPDEPSPRPAEPPGDRPPTAPQEGHGLRTSDAPYAVRPVPPPPSRALIRVVEPGGREREVRVEAEPLTLGRAPDNGLVIADARISRHHGRFQARHGTLVYTDLGSTNGTRVNGIRVDEIVLGPGDRLQMGDVVLVVEQLPR